MWAAWDRLRTTGSRHAAVVDDHQRPVGVLDERTLALVWPSGPMAAHRTPVHSLLRGGPRPRVLGGDEVAAVARIMVGADVDAVPVVDRNGRLYGLVTLWHVAELAAARPTSAGCSSWATPPPFVAERRAGSRIGGGRPPRAPAPPRAPRRRRPGG